MARLTAGGSGTRTVLSPLPRTRSTRSVLLAEIGDVRRTGFEDPQREPAAQRDQREVVTVR